MKIENIFKNGKRVNYGELRRGARTTDTHIFIQNDMLKYLTEIQLNFEKQYNKRIMRSRLINLAIMQFVEELEVKASELSETEALKFIKELDDKYKANYN